MLGAGGVERGCATAYGQRAKEVDEQSVVGCRVEKWSHAPDRENASSCRDVLATTTGGDVALGVCYHGVPAHFSAVPEALNHVTCGDVGSVMHRLKVDLLADSRMCGNEQTAGEVKRGNVA
jgi:hypothetical protein